MFYIIFREFRSHFEKFSAIEKLCDGGVGRNALIAYNATNATSATKGGHEEEAGSQSLMISRQLEREIEKNQLGNPEILKVTSGNAAKRKPRRRCVTAQKRDQRA